MRCSTDSSVAEALAPLYVIEFYTQSGAFSLVAAAMREHLGDEVQGLVPGEAGLDPGLVQLVNRCCPRLQRGQGVSLRDLAVVTHRATLLRGLAGAKRYWYLSSPSQSGSALMRRLISRQILSRQDGQ